MNTNTKVVIEPKIDTKEPKKAGKTVTLKFPNLLSFDDDDDGSVSKVVQALGSVDTNSPNAQMNAHSISDNNGGRIELNEDDEDIIKK